MLPEARMNYHNQLLQLSKPSFSSLVDEHLQLPEQATERSIGKPKLTIVHGGWIAGTGGFAGPASLIHPADLSGSALGGVLSTAAACLRKIRSSCTPGA